MAEGNLVDILGYHFQQDDPSIYLVSWVIVTLFLVALATKYGSLSVGFALTALFGVILWTQRQKLGTATGGGSGGRRL